MAAHAGDAINLWYRPQPSQAQPGAAVVLDYASAAPARRVAVEARAAWPSAVPKGREVSCPMPPVVTHDADHPAPWGVTRPQESITRSDWLLSRQADWAGHQPWGRYSGRLAMAATSVWRLSNQADAADRYPWGEFQHVAGVHIGSDWWVASRADNERATLPWGVGMPCWSDLTARLPASRPVERDYWLPWVRFSRPLQPGWGVIVEPGDPPVDEHGTVIVPVRGVYIVLNEISLTRVADSQALDCLGLSLTLDADSWVCGFQASLPGAALDGVIGSAGSPVELQATINGIVFRLLAEKVSRDRSFGQARISISGRGRAAVLDAPYAPVMSWISAPAITARQAADAAITSVGLPEGWTLNWQLTDWLLPDGLWAHQGTAMSAVLRVAEAAGGYVQADPLSQVLHVRHRYPVAPWDWAAATPDIEIPAAVAITEGIEWEDKPVYNAVYVSGAAGGVLGHVKRAGTDGTLVAQMVTDDLTTHADAARQRGRAILANTGRQARVSLSLPVLPETGIIQPGQLIRYVDGGTTRIGLARGVSVSANLPKIRQTVEIETHA